ncbi:hypothetical protein [Acidovorax sp. FG27]|uniref:hypothetical protein n=1 Tax=Acidovorax sp. FG27 TaxID=3133652 RepID=UPI0030E9001D
MSNPQEKLKVLRTDQCPSLSGRSTLTYELGTDPAGGIHIRVNHNTGKGQFNAGWVGYDAIEPLLKQAKVLSSSVLTVLFPGTSANTPGFMLAVLKHLGIIQAVVDQRHAYAYCDTGVWKVDLQPESATARPAKDDKPKSKR